jgi:hypothetical protein
MQVNWYNTFMNQRVKLKPALVLDDSPSDVKPIARSLRLFAGVDTEYFNSILAWERKYEITFDPTQRGAHDRLYQQVADQLKNYSALVIDNNFEAAGWPDNADEGLPYLTDVISPALSLLQPEERPLVICFAPSNEKLLMDRKEDLWRDHKIICLHKFEEAPYIGILVKIANENGLVISRENLLQDIFGFDPEIIEHYTPASRFASQLMFDYLRYNDEFGEQVEGAALSFDWSNFLKDLASRLNIQEREFLGRIDSVVSKLRKNKEGGLSPLSIK